MVPRPDPESQPVPSDPVPADVRRLWTLAEAPPAPGLSVPAIVAAAVALADADGFGAVSMARVAARLSSAPMSLYRHVADKDELVALMMEAVSAGAPTAAGADWRTRLRGWAEALTALYLAHPWVLQVPVSAPPLGPGQLGWLDRGMHALRDTRLTGTQRMDVVLTVLGYVRGQAVLLSQLGEPAPEAYGAALAALVTPERFPALAAMLSSPPGPETGAGPSTAEDDVADGLELVLDGVAARLRRPAAPALIPSPDRDARPR